MSTSSYSTWLYMEHTFSSIIHNLGGMLNNWSELGGLSAQQSFACSWWICGIQCTLQGGEGKYSAKLCFCFHCKFIDQLFSRALWLWPTVLRRRACDSISPIVLLFVLKPARTCIAYKRHLNFSLKYSRVVELRGHGFTYYSNCLSSS